MLSNPQLKVTIEIGMSGALNKNRRAGPAGSRHAARVSAGACHGQRLVKRAIDADERSGNTAEVAAGLHPQWRLLRATTWCTTSP